MSSRIVIVHVAACTLAALSFFLVGTGSEIASAQTFDLIFGADLSIELTPAHPAPGEQVRVVAHSSLLDLSGATLSWSADGKTISSGNSLTEVTIPAPALGDETRVTVEVLEDGLASAEAFAIIRPVEIDLLWEAGSYVPPFFRGRALPSAGTSLRMEAIPRFVRGGSIVPNRDIIFTWQRDDYVIKAISGRGRSSAVVESPAFLGEYTISVEAKTVDGLFVGEASARIDSEEPRLVLYQNHPIFGIAFHQALGESDEISEMEASFSSIPYYVDAADADDSSLIYRWRVNQIEIQNDPEHPSAITINASGSTGGALIELVLTHLANLLVDSSATWNLLFQGQGAVPPFYGIKI